MHVGAVDDLVAIQGHDADLAVTSVLVVPADVVTFLL